ncbi:MAG: pilus assembly protein PilM [Candidatus Omnitrophica bacterium]|nr:pilus assembly protein PilM [Candidatus Omnitrophota bacterium]
MSTAKRLGIFWGEEGFNLVDVSKETPTESVFIPFPKSLTPGTSAVTNDVQVLDILQKAIRSRGFSTSEAYLSIPSRDIIIRWFVIPSMKPSEIQGVVAFEAKKYIPFGLDELTHTYYPSMITVEGVPQIGILFVGIKKTIFQQYTNVLIQSGLNLVYSEPGSMSLVRAFVARKMITNEEVCAILSITKDQGEIIIASQGFVKFIRDFKLQAGSGPEGVAEMDLVKAKLFNEVRVSMDFFTRQHPGIEVGRVLTISSGAPSGLWAGLGDDLGITVQGVDPSYVMDRALAPDTGALHAYGVALAGHVTSVIDFNLSEGGAAQSIKALTTKPEGANSKILALAVILVCLGIGAVFFANFTTAYLLKQQDTEIAAIQAKLGSMRDMARDEIESKEKLEKRKNDALRSLPVRSRIAPLIIRLISLIPDGIWFENLNVSSGEKGEDGKKKSSSHSSKSSNSSKSAENRPLEYYKLVGFEALTASGYAYLEDSNAEFELINRFVETLRADPDFSARFSDIKFGSLQVQDLKGKKVTSFTITCQ